jgi:hypothetical protein
MIWANFRLTLACVLATIALFAGTLAINEWLFKQLEFVPGINWIYLPAGVRLLCTLLFAEAGAAGLLLVSWAVSYLFLFPQDLDRAFWGGVLATIAPYGVYLAARHGWGLQASLANLTPRRLLLLCLACALASPLLHHVYFALRGQHDLWPSLVAMFVGDLSGTLIVVYTVKGLLALAARPA